MNRENIPDRRSFHLTAIQADYLGRHLQIDDALRSLITSGRSVDLVLSKDQRDHIVDQLGTRLQRAGFDTEWSATEEGLLIESIIDVFTAKRPETS